LTHFLTDFPPYCRISMPTPLSACLNDESLQEVDGAVRGFVKWLETFGETSYDHQSYYAGPIGRAAKSLYYRRPRLGLIAVAPMVLSEALLPSARGFFWKKQRFPIADAHYAMGFALLARRTGEDPPYRKALAFLDVLERTRCPEFREYCWGYPFDWVTRSGVMRANTPLITTTPYCFEAFSAVHELDGDDRWLRVMRSAAEHAFADIKDRVLSEDVATAGYNPFDNEGGVINASAYRAFLLTKASILFSRPDYQRAAERNVNFVLRQQQPNGSWLYAADGVRDFVDHFHTCFVLKALAKIEALIGHAGCRKAIDAGISYYVRNLFDEAGLPRPFSSAPRLTVYRRELYDYAECINLGTLLQGRYPELDQRVRTTLTDLLVRWRKPDGSFRSRELVAGWDSVPMHRWAQSQIFRSLCFLTHESPPPAPAQALARAHAPISAGAVTMQHTVALPDSRA
jgi:hypothetical protein